MPKCSLRQLENARLRYYRNREQLVAARVARRRNTKAELRAQIVALLGRACRRCGFEDARCLSVGGPQGPVSAAATEQGLRTLLEALERDALHYYLLCANCKIIVLSGERGGFRVNKD